MVVAELTYGPIDVVAPERRVVPGPCREKARLGSVERSAIDTRGLDLRA